MILLKVKHHFQVTLPANLRKQFGIAEGDYLQIEATANGILLKRVNLQESIAQGLKDLDQGRSTTLDRKALQEVMTRGKAKLAAARVKAHK